MTGNDGFLGRLGSYHRGAVHSIAFHDCLTLDTIGLMIEDDNDSNTFQFRGFSPLFRLHLVTLVLRDGPGHF